MQTVTTAREKLVSDLKVLIDDVEELVRATADQAGDGLSSLRERVMRRLEEGKETLAQQQKSIWGGRTKQAAKEAAEYAQENPWSAVGVAIGIGLAMAIALVLWNEETRH
jgi:ElaB/YqjD/DUF883 family membrane-anchored ribosome-binding protein